MERNTPKVLFVGGNYANTLAYVDSLLNQQQFTSPSPLVASNETSTTIDLSWSDVSADNYILYRATQSDYSDAVQIYSGAINTFQDTDLTEITTYYYRVKAQKTGNTDSAYATASADTSPSPGPDPDPISILGDKLELWFDNNDTSKITLSGNEATSQTDQTGNYTRSTSSPAANPFYNKYSLFNDGKGYITYEDAQGLRLNVDKLNHSQGEVFVVFRRFANASVGLTNNQAFMAETLSTSENQFCILQDFANSNTFNNSLGIQSSTNAGDTSINRGNSKSLSDKKTIANFRSDGSQYFYGLDNNTSIGNTASSGTNNGNWFGDVPSPNRITFGYRSINSGTVYSTYFEYDIIVCNVMLTNDERQQIIDYLNTKHNCFKSINYTLGVLLFGSSNAEGQSTNLPNRLKVALPKGLIRTTTDTFANLLFGTNNEGDTSSQYSAEMSFISALSEYLDANVYIAKHGLGGARFCVINGSNAVTGSTDTFNVGAADEYPTLKTEYAELKTRLNSVGTNKVCMLLIGGENDTFYSGDSTGFQINLNEVVDELESQVGAFDYFILNLIKDSLDGTGPAPIRQAAFIDNVQAGLTSINSAKGGILLDMANYLTDVDGVHFRGFQQLLIGRDAFDRIRSLL